MKNNKKIKHDEDENEGGDKKILRNVINTMEKLKKGIKKTLFLLEEFCDSDSDSDSDSNSNSDSDSDSENKRRRRRKKKKKKKKRKRRVSRRPRKKYFCKTKGCGLPVKGHPRVNNKLFHRSRTQVENTPPQVVIPTENAPPQVIIPGENAPPQVIIPGENITGKKRKREKVEEEEEEEQEKKKPKTTIVKNPFGDKK